MVFSLLAFSAASVSLASSHLRPQRRAAINHDILQGDMAGVRRGEEQNGIGDLLRAGDFTQRMPSLNCSPKPRIRCCSASSLTHRVRCISVSVEPGDTRLQPRCPPAQAYGQRRAFQRRLRGAIGAHADARRAQHRRRR